jgi:hypothetical protein
VRKVLLALRQQRPALFQQLGPSDLQELLGLRVEHALLALCHAIRDAHAPTAGGAAAYLARLGQDIQAGVVLHYSFAREGAPAFVAVWFSKVCLWKTGLQVGCPALAGLAAHARAWGARHQICRCYPCVRSCALLWHGASIYTPLPLLPTLQDYLRAEPRLGRYMGLGHLTAAAGCRSTKQAVVELQELVVRLRALSAG